MGLLNRRWAVLGEQHVKRVGLKTGHYRTRTGEVRRQVEMTAVKKEKALKLQGL